METFKRAARVELMAQIPMALMDGPWIPGYLNRIR